VGSPLATRTLPLISHFGFGRHPITVFAITGVSKVAQLLLREELDPERPPRRLGGEWLQPEWDIARHIVEATWGEDGLLPELTARILPIPLGEELDLQLEVGAGEPFESEDDLIGAEGGEQAIARITDEPDVRRCLPIPAEACRRGSGRIECVARAESWAHPRRTVEEAVAIETEPARGAEPRGRLPGELSVEGLSVRGEGGVEGEWARDEGRVAPERPGHEEVILELARIPRHRAPAQLEGGGELFGEIDAKRGLPFGREGTEDRRRGIE